MYIDKVMNVVIKVLERVVRRCADFLKLKFISPIMEGLFQVSLFKPHVWNSEKLCVILKLISLRLLKEGFLLV